VCVCVCVWVCVCVCVCVCARARARAELYGDDERRVGCDTVADFSITRFGTSEKRDSFDTR